MRCHEPEIIESSHGRFLQWFSCKNCPGASASGWTIARNLGNVSISCDYCLPGLVAWRFLKVVGILFLEYARSGSACGIDII